MRAKLLTMVLVLGALATPLGAQCGAPPRRVIDWGLHRQWLVEPNCAHPAWPARLVAVPWSEAAARRQLSEGGGGDLGPVKQTASKSTGRTPAPRQDVRLLPVRPGMRVLVVKDDRAAEIRLRGTALEGGAAGSVVLVRAGLRGAVLRTVVTGPARVELMEGRQR